MHKILRKIGLSFVSFDGVHACNVDFLGTNANINTKRVWGKDMNGGKYLLDFSGKSLMVFALMKWILLW